MKVLWRPFNGLFNEVFYIQCPFLLLMGNWVFAMMCITFITNIPVDSMGGTGKFFHSKSVYSYSWLCVPPSSSCPFWLPGEDRRRSWHAVWRGVVRDIKVSILYPVSSSSSAPCPVCLMLWTVVRMVHEITGRICVLVKWLVQGCLSFLKFTDTHVHSVRDLPDIKPDGVWIRSLRPPEPWENGFLLSISCLLSGVL